MERSFVYHNRDGVTRTMHYDEDKPGSVQVFTEVEMDEILESIKRDREAEEGEKFRTNRILARIPMTVYEQSLLEQWDDDRWKHWLNHPDNAHLRVWRGRV